MINTARHGIKELETSELNSLVNLNSNADLLDKAIDRWGTASWSENILQVTSEVPSQELYTGMSLSLMLSATNPENATIKLDSLDEKSLLNSTGASMTAGTLTAGQIYSVTYDGTAFRINNVAHATSADSATSAANADTVDGMHAADFATAAQGAKADAALPLASYTAADVLAKIETVDGARSGLDADTLDGLDSTAFATADSLTAHLSDSKFQTAGGTATAITVPTATLSDGYAKTFIASASNSGTATTINGLPLYKPNSTTAPTLTAGKAYTVWYSSSGSCFFLKASAEGTATASDVLAGKTFSNDDDTGLTGAIATKTSSNLTVSGAIVTAPAGYYASDASKSVTAVTLATPSISVSTGGLITATDTQAAGYVAAGTKSATQQMKVKAAQTYTPSATEQTIAAGQYLLGDQTITALKVNTGSFVIASACTTTDPSSGTIIDAPLYPSYTSELSHTMGISGTVTVCFTMKTRADNSESAYLVYGQIYKNSIAYGTLQSNSEFESSHGVTYSQDITVNAGDVIAICFSVSDSGGKNSASIRNLGISCSFPNGIAP